jgi:hypothetical protein
VNIKFLFKPLEKIALVCCFYDTYPQLALLMEITEHAIGRNIPMVAILMGFLNSFTMSSLTFVYVLVSERKK